MTVVEAYVGDEKLDPPNDIKRLASNVSSVLIEGIAQNTTGSVFTPEVFKLLGYFLWKLCETSI